MIWILEKIKPSSTLNLIWILVKIEPYRTPYLISILAKIEPIDEASEEIQLDKWFEFTVGFYLTLLVILVSMVTLSVEKSPPPPHCLSCSPPTLPTISWVPPFLVLINQAGRRLYREGSGWAWTRRRGEGRGRGVRPLFRDWTDL